MIDNLIQSIKKNAIPLHEADHYNSLINEINQANYVLFGESSHGTSEFYKVRAELTKRLIEEKGFTYIAVEGDWPACQQVNRYVKGYDNVHTNAREVLTAFNRWPTWMWANEEIIDLIEWLKIHNQKLTNNLKVGFYGIDVYSLWESMDEIINYLEKINSPDIEKAKKAFACFEPFNREPQMYGVSASFYAEGCHDEVIKLLTDITLNKNKYSNEEESHLNLEVNAIITANAENYYRTMVMNDQESWNIRDRHMVEVIQKISSYYGDHAKGIIWEHNTHVGDARATDMADGGMVNVGQLLREQEGIENVFIVGFGTHQGTVIASEAWGVNFERMIVPPAQKGSWEDLMFKAGPHDKILIFNEKNRHDFSQRIGHRAIGVVYDPNYEHFGNYVPSVMSARYDAFIYIHSTNALHPLEVEKMLI
ncbi:putative erythromycin esterase [Neobacillus bataviensis LMG 21833]|uniref:Putative erythromycin esterase n=1 Tax=Neobacillus bataviensis LMG 21833 TaxID=1117379 RepID=K6CR57_9BACI|nr:erythromycin esterase family protein [Neobacillus bataviensis]EKN62737.1 putative erythromycin esterase [Neobacillus bataviensis LMG 21833]